jgi:hypothetical protein
LVTRDLEQRSKRLAVRAVVVYDEDVGHVLVRQSSPNGVHRVTVNAH